jgi:putative ABC transport system permease protein
MKRRKARTALTTLGIIVGIMAMIGISALSTSFENQITGQLTEGIEMDLLTVLPTGAFGQFGGTGGGISYVTVNESEYIAENITGVVGVLPVMQQSATLFNAENETLQTRLIGVNFTQFANIHGDRHQLEEGDWPDPSVNNTCILGYVDPIFAVAGEEITLEVLKRTGFGFEYQNYTFSVSARIEEVGSSAFTPFDRSCFIPLNTAMSIFESEELTSITVRISEPLDADNIADEIEEYYEDQVMVIVPSSIIATISNVFSIMEIFLLAIASIALLVAGISILNIMLVSVMERTREIGIMKALGAKKRTIMGQFLAEAVLLGILGGILGIVFGWGLAYGMGQLLPRLFSGIGGDFNMSMNGMGDFSFTPIITPDMIITAIGFAVIVSVIFALYPAWKAAKQDPVKALRYE